MPATRAFFEHLLTRGEAVLDERPTLPREERPALVELLESAYREHRLAVAGPLLPFDGEAAVAAAMLLAQACWFLVSADEPSTEVERALRFPLEPANPEAHLSADLCLRFLNTVHRRARTRTPDDPLHRAVVDVLRRWPLS